MIVLALAISLVAAWFDLRSQIIPNWLTGSAVLLGLGLAFIPGGVTPQAAALGMFAGGGLFLLFWLFHVVGAGDVKLVAAVGALVGWPMTWEVIFFTALAGGLVGLVYLIWAPPEAPESAESATDDKEVGASEAGSRGSRRRILKRRVPYAPAVALGVLLSWLL